MFNLFKKTKKDKPKKERNQDTVKMLSEEEKKQRIDEIESMKNRLKEKEIGLGLELEQKAEIAEKIGLLYFDLSDAQKAIHYLEESLNDKPSIGDGFKALMSLYNKERQKAAEQKDSEAIEKYMKKMENMRNLAKKGTLSR